LTNLLQIWYRDGERTPPAYAARSVCVSLSIFHCCCISKVHYRGSYRTWVADCEGRCRQTTSWSLQRVSCR